MNIARTLLLCLSSVVACTVDAAESPAGGGVPLTFDEPAVELAELMGQLQLYAHKLTLSVDAHNAPLARFYLEEATHLMTQMQALTPEYEGIPVALYLDRMGLPAADALAEALPAEAVDVAWTAIDQATDAFIDACNRCHAASQHGFIRIKRHADNPFLQDFSPE
ncbi:MAG: hypothetical protein AAF184_20720 [Pseudomonadota bacterium]